MSLGNVYLASGWFNPEWMQEVENIKSVFEKHAITYFSPKDENLCDADASESMQDQFLLYAPPYSWYMHNQSCKKRISIVIQDLS